jgi:hypothetical protein
MNDRWDGPFKISQNVPDTPTSPPTWTQKRAKKMFSLKIFSRTKTGRVKNYELQFQ